MSDLRPAWDLEQTADYIGLRPDTLRKRRRELHRTLRFPLSCGPTRKLAWRPEEVEAWQAARRVALGEAPGLPANDSFEVHEADRAARRRAPSAARIHNARADAMRMMRGH